MSTIGGTMITLVHQLERENLESYYNLPGTPVRERELEYQGDTWVLLIHNSTGIYIRKTYILLYHAFSCFIMLYHALSCFSVKAREKYKKSNPPYFSKCLGIRLKK